MYTILCLSIVSMSCSSCRISDSILSFRAFFDTVSVTTLNPWYCLCKSSQFFFKPSSISSLKKKIITTLFHCPFSSCKMHTYTHHYICSHTITYAHIPLHMHTHRDVHTQQTHHYIHIRTHTVTYAYMRTHNYIHT